MGMSNAIRRELGKCRELLWHLLEGKNCCFCHKPLLVDGVPDYVVFGNGSAPPLDLDITIHHKDENHGNNEPSNRKLAHEKCHREHHAVKTFGNWRKAVAA